MDTITTQLKAKAEDLMEQSIQARKRGDVSKAADLCEASTFFLTLMIKAAGEDLEGVAR